MKTYQGLFMPEHKESEDIVKCCISANERSNNCLTCFSCSGCLFSHINNDAKQWKYNNEIFLQWIAAGRITDEENKE